MCIYTHSYTAEAVQWMTRDDACLSDVNGIGVCLLATWTLLLLVTAGADCSQLAGHARAAAVHCGQTAWQMDRVATLVHVLLLQTWRSSNCIHVMPLNSRISAYSKTKHVLARIRSSQLLSYIHSASCPNDISSKYPFSVEYDTDSPKFNVSSASETLPSSRQGKYWYIRLSIAQLQFVHGQWLKFRKFIN